MYGGDYKLPGMLYGRILRSPHAHARIRSIDTSAAEKLPGVKAVMTAKDLPGPEIRLHRPRARRGEFLARHAQHHGAREGLYEGHAVAAVAATSASIADEALALIKVDYEVLPHVIDVDEAMADGRAAAVRGHDHPRHRAGADQALQHLEAAGVQDRRHRRRLRRRPMW